jgi:KUP system potassium uptake protein
VAVVALVVGFGSSQHLAAAYGIAVTGTLAIDTVLFFVVVHIVWGKPKGLAVTGAIAFLIVDLTFFTANLPKIVHGGWFPLAIAAVVFLVLTTWQRGREIITKKRTELEGPLRDFVEEIRDPEKPISRSPRTGIFLDANPETTPLALRANVEHNCVLHDSVVIVTVVTLNVPHVDEEERVTVDDLGYRDDGITHLTARFGFQDDLDVPRTLRRAAKRLERDADFEHVSYFLSRITIIPGKAPGLALWRKKLFIAIARNAASPVPYFHLPDDRTIVMSAHIEL